MNCANGLRTIKNLCGIQYKQMVLLEKIECVLFNKFSLFVQKVPSHEFFQKETSPTHSQHEQKIRIQTINRYLIFGNSE